MTSSSIRVVPPYRSRGLASAAFLWGAGGTGAQLSHLEQHLRLWGLTPVQEALIMLGVVLLPAAILAVVLCRVTQRVRPFIIASIASNSGFFAWSIADSIYRSQDSFAFPSHSFSMAQPVALLVTTAIMIGFFLGTRWLVRATWFLTLEQTGLLCTGCGYDRGSDAIARCPECGRDAAGSRYSRGRFLRAVASFHRVSRILLVAAVLFLLVAGTWFVITRTLPTRSFYSGFPRGVPCWSYIDVHNPPSGAQSQSASAVSIAIPDDPMGRELMVMFVPNDIPSFPALRLALAIRTATSVMPDFGTEMVWVDLGREQAERLIREGIPDEFVSRLLRKASELGWKANPGFTRTMNRHELSAREMLGW